MHPEARLWDAKHHMTQESRSVPKGRPCDLCGRAVDEGFIHLRCLNQEIESYRADAAKRGGPR
jgi:hypothetical protein